MFFTFLTRKKLFENYFFLRMCAKQRSATCKKRREFWRELNTPLWLLIGPIIFFTCENHSSLLWLARTHLRINIYNTTFWWVFLSMYIIKLHTQRRWNLPGEGKRCSKSRKIGHFAAVCRSVRKVTSDLGEILSNFSLELLTRLTSYEEPRSVELHTRADISVISVSAYQALPELPRPKPLNAVLSSPGRMLNWIGVSSFFFLFL